MKIFMDTANVEEIAKFVDWGVVYGVTTNPSLIAKSGRTQAEVRAAEIWLQPLLTVIPTLWRVPAVSCVCPML